MANAFYAKGKEKILSGAIDHTTHVIKAALVKSAYTPNLATDEFFSTISANVLNTPQTLAGKSVAAGVFDANDLTFTAVTAGDTGAYIVIYKDTGVAGTSPLLACLDTVTNFPVTTNGGDVPIVWDNGAYKIYSL